jgi:hypothetical protein
MFHESRFLLVKKVRSSPSGQARHRSANQLAANACRTETLQSFVQFPGVDSVNRRSREACPAFNSRRDEKGWLLKSAPLAGADARDDFRVRGPEATFNFAITSGFHASVFPVLIEAIRTSDGWQPHHRITASIWF